MGDGSSELKKFWHLYLGWWWLLVLGVISFVAAAYLVNIWLPPIYKASATIIVEPQQQPGTTSQVDILTSESLADNYAQLIKMRPTLEKVLTQIAPNLPAGYGIGRLSRNINTRVVISKTGGRTNLIKITAFDKDRDVAATIANVTATTFIDSLQERQLSELFRFQEVLSEYGIRQNTQIVANQAAMLDIISIVEPAVPSFTPSNKTFTTLVVSLGMGFALGLLIPGIGIAWKEYMDDRIKSPDDLKRLTGSGPLAVIPRYRGRTGPTVISAGNNRRFGPFSESYKLLLTNLQLTSGGKPEAKTVLVTSPGISEGKSSTAANLAISAAKQGKAVILVDCDLRSPSLHRVFDLPDHEGLTGVLTEDITLEAALTPTGVEGLQVITSGPALPDPGVALSSPEMYSLLQELKKRADLVILDSPSLIAVTDSLLLASLADDVLLVVRAAWTSGESLNRATDILKQIDAHVVGIVLNQVKGDAQAEGYHRHYMKLRENGRVRRWPLGFHSLPNHRTVAPKK